MGSANTATIERLNQAMQEERWNDAIAIADGAIPEAPENQTLLWSAGWARFKLGLMKEAIEYLVRAVDTEPTSASACWSVGAVCSEAGDTDAAELWLLRALALRDTSLGRLSLALNYQRQGLTEMAEVVHKEGLRRAPGSRERLEAFADFLSDMGREMEAEEQRAKAKELEGPAPPTPEVEMAAEEEISNGDLERIEQLCRAATPPPWRSFVEGRDHESGSDFIQTPGDDIELSGASRADQDFIASARQDVPRLVAEVRRLRSAGLAAKG